MSALLNSLLVVAFLAISISAFQITEAPVPDVFVTSGQVTLQVTYPVASSLTVQEVCANVGRLTGCSGCTHGTKGLCSWVQTSFSGAAEFSCMTTVDAIADEVLGNVQLAGHLCPANPSKEPMIREEVVVRSDVTDVVMQGQRNMFTFYKPVVSFPVLTLADTLPREEVSEIFSQTFNADLFHAADGSATITVDRTSLYGDLGFAKLSGYGSAARNDVSCATLAQDGLFDINLLTHDAGQLYSEHIRFCLIGNLHAYYNFRCTPYGVAKSGICRSAYDKALKNCAELDQQALRATTNTFSETYSRLNTFLVDVVEDSTPFCVNDEFLQASPRAIHLAGLDKPIVSQPCTKRGVEGGC